MGQRLYVAALGRFLQVDPVEGGVESDYIWPTDPVGKSDLDGTLDWDTAFAVADVVSIGLMFIPGVGTAAGLAIRGVTLAARVVRAGVSVARAVAPAVRAAVRSVPGAVRAGVGSSRIHGGAGYAMANSSRFGVNSRLFGNSRLGWSGPGRWNNHGATRLGWSSHRGQANFRLSARWLPVNRHNGQGHPNRVRGPYNSQIRNLR